MTASSSADKPWVRPKKNLGQHFLTDLNIAKKIVQALPAQAGDVVTEIGPGTGVLSRILVTKGVSLNLVELDPESVEVLETEFEGKDVRIFNESFLGWNPESQPNPYSWFIGNLPYNISSPIFFHLLSHLRCVRGGVFMVQKEVAERICSKHGSKVYGILSVLMQAYFKVKYEFTVSEQVFFPKPKVKSSVFSILPLPSENLPDFPRLKAIVKAGFNQRRKTLRNALGRMQLKDFPGREEWLGKRAEQLSVADWIFLSSQLDPAVPPDTDE